MHQNLWLLCELLRELNPELQITLLSTGLLLKTFARDVVKWCDEVIVSVDGSREVHDGIRRVPRAFDRLAEGIAALREHQPGYPVSARCVLQRTNFRDLPNIVAAAHEIGLNRISFMSVDVSSTAFNRPTPWAEPRASEVALDRAETAEFAAVVEDTIQRYASDFETRFISESPDKLRRLPRYYAALNGLGEFPTTVCNAPWVSSVVEADGTVRPCFFHAAFGNIHEQSLESILNSPEAIAFRRDLDVTTNPILQVVRVHAVAGQKVARLNVSVAYDAIAAGYDEQVRGDNWMRRKLHTHYLQAFAPGQRVLDVGCGTGIDALFLASQGIDVVGVDASAQMIQHLRQRVAAEPARGRIEAHVMQIEALTQLGEVRFDGVVAAFASLNTLPELTKFASDAARLVRRAGGWCCTS